MVAVALQTLILSFDEEVPWDARWCLRRRIRH